MTQSDKTNGHHERLRGWKEIGEFLRVHPRTIQRWLARGVGVPVYRVGNGKTSLVFADPQELDAWMRSEEGLALRRVDDCSAGPLAPLTSLVDDETGEPAVDEGDSCGSGQVPPAAGNGTKAEPSAAAERQSAGDTGGFESQDSETCVKTSSAAGPGESRRPGRWLILALAASALVLACAVLGVFLFSPRPDASEAAPARGTAGPTSYALHLTTESGIHLKMGIAIGAWGRYSIPGREIMMVPAQQAGHLLLHLYLVEPAGDAFRFRSELGTLRLEPNRPVAAPPETGIRSIEWVKGTGAPPSSPGRPTNTP